MAQDLGRTAGGASAIEGEAPERRDAKLEEKSALISLAEMVWFAPYVRDITHCHNFLEIGICVEGSGRLLLGSAQNAVAFEPGVVALIPSGLYHSQQNEGGSMTRWRYINVDARRLMAEAPTALRGVIVPFLEAIDGHGACMHNSRQAARAANVISMMYEMKNRMQEDALPEQEALLLLLLATLAREPVKPGGGAEDPQMLRPIEPALNYIASHFESELRVAQMARVCAMSESHFRRTFAQIMGVSPLEYLNRYRIQRAKELLRASRRPVQQIALECGFISIATFNRNFIRYVGYSPSEWRQMREDMPGKLDAEPDA